MHARPIKLLSENVLHHHSDQASGARGSGIDLRLGLEMFWVEIAGRDDVDTTDCPSDRFIN